MKNHLSSNTQLNQEEVLLYLKDVRKEKVMTLDREKEIKARIQSDDIGSRELKELHDELVTSNLRFVISVAKQYQNQGVELPDLIAEGNMGLFKAVKNMDWNKDNKFLSYAVWWVRQSIISSLNENSRTIRLPVNIILEKQRAEKEDRSKGTGIPEKFINLPTTMSYDQPHDDEGNTIIDMLYNRDEDSPESVFYNNTLLMEKLQKLISKVLDHRESVIIRDYFGLSQDAPKRLEEIGNDIELTKERVRQIKVKALRKLRNASQELFEFM